MKKIVLLAFVSILLLMIAIVSSSNVLAWSNGGYSDDPSNPDYGTHDWIAEHALDWLPEGEKGYIVANLAAYLYGTELPDNGGAPDGIGDTVKHHIYYWSNGTLQEDDSAVRASEEYSHALNFLKLEDLENAAKTAGIMSHYIVDVAVFGHVMGAGTDWGAEEHHSDYETYVNQRTSSYDAEFNVYLSFDGELDLVSAYEVAKELAYDTTFDVDGDLTCVWMDQNYNWSDPVFKNRCGESLNLAVNYLTDVLHMLYVEALPEVPPIISIFSPENRTYSTTSISLEFTVSKATSWIGYSLDGQTNVTVSGNTTLLGLCDGPHTLVVYANDTAGNMGYSMVCFSVDTVSPNIEILSPENKTYATNSVFLSLIINEPTSWIGYSLDSQTNNTIAGNTTLTSLPDGLHYVTVYANDTVGNIGASNTVHFTVDTTPPNITVVSQIPSKNNVLPEDEVKVNVTVTDNLSGVKQITLNYTSGNGIWNTVHMTNLEGNIWTATIPEFPYCTNVTYMIIAEDTVGNTITTEEMGYEYQYHVIPEFPAFALMLLILTVLTVCLGIYKRRVFCCS